TASRSRSPDAGVLSEKRALTAYRPLTEALIDLGFAHPESIAEELTCVASKGGRSTPCVGWRPREAQRAIGDGQLGSALARDVDEHVACPYLRMLGSLRDGVQRTAREPRFVEGCHPFGSGPFRDGCAQNRLELGMVTGAKLHRQKTSVRAEVWVADNAAELRP